MRGLEISVTNSDLVIKQEERLIKLYVIFKDKKYGTKYVIFTDNQNKNLCYGSPLINGNKMVIMKFKNIKDEELIKEFTWDYLNNSNSQKYELIEIPKIEKLEIIDNNILEVKEEYINKLNDIFFKPEELTTEKLKQNKKKSKGPLLFALILILLGISAFIYLKNNQELLFGENIYVECKKIGKIEEITANTTEIVSLTFSNSQDLKEHKKEITYVFENIDKYYEFKEKDLKYKYITEEGIDKFIDEQTYNMIINYDIKNSNLPKIYNELFDYYNNLGYSCNNIEKE